MKKGIEIEISTYNRKEILEKWIEYNYVPMSKLGIRLAIYDSSTNNDTENMIAEINNHVKEKIKYVRLGSDVRVDEKVLVSMLESEYTYVWPLGDSRKIDFDDIEKKVIPFIEKKYDFVCIWCNTLLNNDKKTYTNVVDFFNECFWHATWLGGLILKKELLLDLNNKDKLDYYLCKYCRNDGFSYLGIFFDLIANKQILAAFSLIHIKELGINKKPAWIKRYLEVWCDNLCYLIDNLSDIYAPVKSKVVKEVWKVLELDQFFWCYAARKAGGLNKKIFKHYDNIGYIDRVSDNKLRIKRVATWNIFFLDIYNLLLKFQIKMKRILENKKYKNGYGIEQ